MCELKKIGKVFTSKFVGTGPWSYKKRIYRAAVSQRLRNTDLGVACWPLVPKFADSNPAEAVGFFKGEKILSTPSFGGEVKPSVPRRRFASRKNP